jgi:hypothetical protein
MKNLWRDVEWRCLTYAITLLDTGRHPDASVITDAVNMLVKTAIAARKQLSEMEADTQKDNTLTTNKSVIESDCLIAAAIRQLEDDVDSSLRDTLSRLQQ